VTTTIDPQNTGAQPRVAEADGASLEKVRDLLFGVHMRDNDRKFARLEERLAKDTSDLREEVKKRLAAIEGLIRQEVESLSERLKAEQDDRSTAAKDLARELNESARAFERRASQLDDQMARGLRDLRQALHEQHQGMSEELRLLADDFVARLSRESQELRGDKADRATLAALFTEMAMRLNGEFRLPGGEDGPRA
jgi:DNA anti-recombination protein RmuC